MDNNSTSRIVTRLIRFGTGPSGYTYTKAVLQEWLERWGVEKPPIFGVMANETNSWFDIDLTKVATKVVDMFLDDEGLVVVQEVLSTPSGKELSKLIDSDTSFTITPQVGGSSNNGVVESMELYYISIDK